MTRHWLAALLLGVIAVGGLAVACGDGGENTAVAQLAPPQERVIHMAAYELKGGTSVESEAFPGGELSGGYGLKEPNADGRWEVQAYTWLPSQIEVNQGDTVTLEIVGINGAIHNSSIENYIDSFVIERGKITTLTFVADAPGVFKILCGNHPESMIGELVVRARAEA